jgi:hypothetical protein
MAAQSPVIRSFYDAAQKLTGPNELLTFRNRFVRHGGDLIAGRSEDRERLQQSRLRS